MAPILGGIAETAATLTSGCVEACPTDAITHGHDFALASYNLTDLIYRRKRLLAAGQSTAGGSALSRTAIRAVLSFPATARGHKENL